MGKDMQANLYINRENCVERRFSRECIKEEEHQIYVPESAIVKSE